uniref:G patch domain-containing protein 11 n=1 Tax=Clastoptera arizonana TaxID=38151 RepID=A0A1B6CCU6_9HEMI
MATNNDEDDYMSETFISDSIKEDLRPSLIRSQSEKHRHEISKKKMKPYEKDKPRSLIEAINREKGLSKPISSDNIGFKMMQKLGFQAGAGLGKLGDGTTEPIPINCKNDRKGLGREAALKEIKQIKTKIRSEHLQKLTNVMDFRARIREKSEEKRDMIDLVQSQRACRDLDQRNAIEPEEVWFWPENSSKELESKVNEDGDSKSNPNDPSDNETEDDLGQDFSIHEKLQMLTLYLRTTYFYCVWCGTTYEDYNDIASECPGSTRSDH